MDLAIAFLIGLVAALVVSSFSVSHGRRKAIAAYMSGWNDAARALGDDPIGAEHATENPNPLRLGIGDSILYTPLPHHVDGEIFRKTSATHFTSRGLRVLTVNDLASTELDGASWHVVVPQETS